MTIREYVKARPNLHTISCDIVSLVCGHPVAAAVGAAAFLLLAGCFVFWYEVFSGFAEPVQFIYTTF